MEKSLNHLRVLIVTTNFPRWKGDFRAPFILEAARALVNNDHQVRVLTMHNPGSLEYEKFDEIEVYRIRYAKDKDETLQKDSAGIPAAWKQGFSSKRRLFRFFMNLSIGIIKHSGGMDVIHANWTLSGMAVFSSKIFHRLPYVVTIHGSDIYGVDANPGLSFPTRITLNNAKKVIAVSQDLRKKAEELGVHADKMVVIPTGVNLSTFPFNPYSARSLQILFVGSLIQRKGVNVLLEAFSQILPHFPTVKLVIVGEGEEESNLLIQAEKLNISENVIFLGTKNQSEVSHLMQDSKIFVLPSLEEGQGAVLVEAMASGTPCIGSRVGGIPGVIDSSTGLLFAPGNSEELAGKLVALLTDFELWTSFAVNGRKKAETQYSWSNLANQIADTYSFQPERLNNERSSSK
jgi:glycosyltransferase involved in cell wall biosynthesis